MQSADQFSIDDVLKRIKRKPPSDERYKIKQRIPKSKAGGRK
jgi:hypothetical protein